MPQIETTHKTELFFGYYPRLEQITRDHGAGLARANAYDFDLWNLAAPVGADVLQSNAEVAFLAGANRRAVHGAIIYDRRIRLQCHDRQNGVINDFVNRVPESNLHPRAGNSFAACVAQGAFYVGDGATGKVLRRGHVHIRNLDVRRVWVR